MNSHEACMPFIISRLFLTYNQQTAYCLAADWLLPGSVPESVYQRVVSCTRGIGTAHQKCKWHPYWDIFPLPKQPLLLII